MIILSMIAGLDTDCTLLGKTSITASIAAQCCGTLGIECDPLSRITSINWNSKVFTNNALTGFEKLASLQNLVITQCNIIDIGKLPYSLVKLILNDNSLGGMNLIDLSFNSNLKTLAIRNCKITNSVFVLPSSLTSIDMLGNQLTYSPDFSLLSQLQVLNMQSINPVVLEINNIPKSISTLTLTGFKANGLNFADFTTLNQLTISNMQNMSDVVFSQNLTTLSINSVKWFDINATTSWTFKGPENMKSLSLFNFPISRILINNKSFVNATNLFNSYHTLKLKSVQLTNFPKLTSSLRVLDLSNNLLTSFPNYMPALTELYLAFNQLTGGFPSNLPNSIQYLNLEHNKLSGSISILLPAQLVVFVVSYNNFNGTIPTWPSKIKLVFLWHNQFSGIVPPIPASIEYYFIMDNQLEGQLPKINTLVVLDAGNNKLNGTLPAIANNLRFLDICGNTITGSLPVLPDTLNQLNLGNQTCYGNNITGEISVTSGAILKRLNIYKNSISKVDILAASVSDCDLRGNGLNTSNIKISPSSNCKRDDLVFNSSVTYEIKEDSQQTEYKDYFYDEPFTYFEDVETTTLLYNVTDEVIISDSATQMHTKTLNPLSYGTSSIAMSTLSTLNPYMHTSGRCTSSNSGALQSTLSGQQTSVQTSLQSDLQSEFELLSTTSIASSAIQDIRNNQAGINDYLIFILLGVFFLIMVVTVALKYLLKTPQIRSKFGRKNSFASLNTFQTTIKTNQEKSIFQ